MRNLFAMAAMAAATCLFMIGCNGFEGGKGSAGQSGSQGEPGASGMAGASGSHCWDLNMDGANDSAEDVNGDGAFDVRDCMGERGERGEAGSDGPVGAQGTTGPQGQQGEPGEPGNPGQPGAPGEPGEPGEGEGEGGYEGEGEGSVEGEGDEPQPEPECQPGTGDCSCYRNGTCDGFLLCEDGMCMYDSDGDGISDWNDNCWEQQNVDQADLDQDGDGDKCDGDVDGDGITNAGDTCPRIPNPDNDPVRCAPPAECRESEQCDDGNACTTDICNMQGRCTHNFIVCEDGIQCSQDTCNPGYGCSARADDAKCPAGQLCFVWEDALRQFQDVPAEGCYECTQDWLGREGQCDDGNACTIDLCGDNRTCSHEARECAANQGLSCVEFMAADNIGETWACTRDEDGDGYYNVIPRGVPENTRVDCNDRDAFVHPLAREVCGNGLDDDCDGFTDDQDACPRDCNPTAVRVCGTDTGECVAGQQTCDANGRWGSCIGEVRFVAESCNSRDDDCDGQTDEGLNCAPAGGGGPGADGGTDIARMCVPNDPAGTWQVSLWNDPQGAGTSDVTQGNCVERTVLTASRLALRMNARRPNQGLYCAGWVNNPQDLRNGCPGYRFYLDGVEQTLEVVNDGSGINYRIRP